MKKIWEEIRERLGLSGEEESSDERLVEYAAAALLLETCDSDLHVDERELAMVRKALTRSFGLSEATVEELLSRARSERRQRVSFHPQVEIINEYCSAEEKRQIVEQVWRVAFADGRLDKYEEHYVRRLCDLIHVPHRIFIQTRLKIEERS